MEISLEAIDAVRERTGVSYKEAKEALEQTEGSVVDAIVLLEDKSGARTNDVLEKIKALVKEGNVNKIRVKRDDKVLLTVPVNAGIAGGLVGLAVAPWWGVLAAAAAFFSWASTVLAAVCTEKVCSSRFLRSIYL